MKMQKNVALILLVIMLFSLTAIMVSPTEAFADPKEKTEKTDINDIKLAFDKDGNLEVTGLGSAKNKDQAWETLFEQYQGVIVGISGVGALTMIALFIIQFIKLGASAGNPQARSQALSGVLWTGLAATGLGGVTVFVGFFYNAL